MRQLPEDYPAHSALRKQIENYPRLWHATTFDSGNQGNVKDAVNVMYSDLLEEFDNERAVKNIFINKWNAAENDWAAEKVRAEALLTDRQADEKLIGELVDSAAALLGQSGTIYSGSKKAFAVVAIQDAIGRAQTRLRGEAPFETDNQKLIEDI